eukprot:gene15030-21101_t
MFAAAASQDVPSEIPSVYMCPLTMEVFREPVITPYGLTYENVADHGTVSPDCGTVLRLRCRVLRLRNSALTHVLSLTCSDYGTVCSDYGTVLSLTCPDSRAQAAEQCSHSRAQTHVPRLRNSAQTTVQCSDSRATCSVSRAQTTEQCAQTTEQCSDSRA